MRRKKSRGRHGKYSRTSTTTHTVSGKTSSATNSKGQTSNTNTSPVTTSTTTKTSGKSSSGSSRGGLPSPAGMNVGGGGNAQVVMVLGVALFIFANWTSIVKPYLDKVWNKSATVSTPIHWQGSVGMLIVLVVMVFLASVNDDMGGLMLLSMLGMWMVYVIHTGAGGNVSQFLNWMTANSTSTGKKSTPPVGEVPGPTKTTAQTSPTTLA